MVVNSQGSAIGVNGTTLLICRPDDLLATTFDTGNATEITLTNSDMEAFDVRIITPGAAYSSARNNQWPELRNCSQCSPGGPYAFPEVGVVVHRTGDARVTAVSTDDLAEVWTRDLDGYGMTLHGGPSGVYVEVLGNGFLRLDPATGETVWQLAQDSAERSSALTGHRGEVWLLRSSFGVTGDERAPLVRSIDVETGETRWQAAGRPASSWQWTRPVVMDNVVVMMDVSTWAGDPDLPSARLQAFDAATGALLWSTKLDSHIEAFDRELLVVSEFETSNALLARTIEGELLRVDPQSGEVLWRQTIGSGLIGGTAYGDDGRLMIDVSNVGGSTLIDPDTGEIVP